MTSSVVMITGAAGQLGRSVVEAFDADGASLVLVDIEGAALRDVFGGDGERRLLRTADLLDPLQAAAAVEAANGRFGRVDVLCHLTGGFRMGEPVHATADETWDFLFDVNVRTLRHAARAVVPRMIDGGGGRIVCVGALSARQGVAGMGAYCAAKAAVQRLAESMDAELHARGIRVNCVLPSVIDTPANRAAMPDTDPADWVATQAIADTICWLASDRSCALRGASLPVTGR